MALAFRTSSNGGAGTSGTGALTLNATVSTTSGDIVFVAVGQNNASDVSNAPTDTIGNTYHLLTSAFAYAASGVLAVWYAVSTGTNASNVITSTVSTKIRYSFSTCAYSGFTSLGQTTTAKATSTNPSISITINGANNFVVGFFSDNTGSITGNAYTAQTGTLEQQNNGSSSGNNRATAIIDNTSASSGTSVTDSATIASNAWGGIAAELWATVPFSAEKTTLTDFLCNEWQNGTTNLERITLADVFVQLDTTLSIMSESISLVDILSVPGGGQAFSQSILESLTIADILVFSTFLNITSEAVTVSDKANNTVGIFNVGLNQMAESITLADFVSNQWQNYTTGNEAITLSDGIGSFQSGPVESESLTITDKLVEFDVSLQSLFSESLSLADLISNQPQPSAYSESLSLTDAVSFTTAPSTLETITLSDVWAEFDVSLSLMNESISLTDVLTPPGGQALSQSILESLTVTDAISQFDMALNVTNETITLADQLGPFQPGLVATESLTIASALPEFRVTLSIMNESITIASAIAELDTALNVMSEAISLADAFPAFNFSLSVTSETLTISDKLVNQPQLSGQSESISISDAVLNQAQLSGQNETISISDRLVEFDASLSIMSETVIVSDAFSQFDVAFSVMNESVTASDAFAFGAVLATMNEQIVFTDSFMIETHIIKPKAGVAIIYSIGAYDEYLLNGYVDSTPSFGAQQEKILNPS